VRFGFEPGARESGGDFRYGSRNAVALSSRDRRAYLPAETAAGFRAARAVGLGGHELRSVSTACRAEGERVHHLRFHPPPAPFSKAASMPRSTASSGTPAFFQVSQRPIERRHQKQRGAAGTWKCSSTSVK